jgi:hypothetical protein
MEIDDKYFLKHKRNYLRLFLKIWTMRRQGSESPKDLLQQAHNLGRLAGISEEELKNL